ncbi:hypothetical protein KC887_09470 [Candidatus Kaiserbacteria bacterium]|nr:hypothetical protein [Candidatus Kaiserbacteria bacterium]
MRFEEEIVEVMGGFRMFVILPKTGNAKPAAMKNDCRVFSLFTLTNTMKPAIVIHKENGGPGRHAGF